LGVLQWQQHSCLWLWLLLGSHIVFCCSQLSQPLDTAVLESCRHQGVVHAGSSKFPAKHITPVLPLLLLVVLQQAAP
jgi:hypothetical protein